MGRERLGTYCPHRPAVVTSPLEQHSLAPTIRIPPLLSLQLPLPPPCGPSLLHPHLQNISFSKVHPVHTESLSYHANTLTHAGMAKVRVDGQLQWAWYMCGHCLSLSVLYGNSLGAEREPWRLLLHPCSYRWGRKALAKGRRGRRRQTAGVGKQPEGLSGPHKGTHIEKSQAIFLL